MFRGGSWHSSDAHRPSPCLRRFRNARQVGAKRSVIIDREYTDRRRAAVDETGLAGKTAIAVDADIAALFRNGVDVGEDATGLVEDCHIPGGVFVHACVIERRLDAGVVVEELM